MISFEKIASLDAIADWKRAYLQTLIAPLDGYWKTAVIDRAPHYIIIVNGRALGYLAADDQTRLLQFYAVEKAAELFAAVIGSEWVETAVASTIDPAVLSLCLDVQKSVSVNTYLFHDEYAVAPPLPAYPQAQFRLATEADLAPLVRFYGRNDEYEDTAAITDLFESHRNYVKQLIKHQQSFLLIDGDTILGIGECRVSQSQPPYADIGMIVDKDHRQNSIGTFILAHLKAHCTRQNLKPICSCAADNIASRKTIERAGFVAYHRILEIQWQEENSELSNSTIYR